MHWRGSRRAIGEHSFTRELHGFFAGTLRGGPKPAEGFSTAVRVRLVHISARLFEMAPAGEAKKMKV